MLFRSDWTLITDPAGLLQAWTMNREQFGDSLGEGALVGLALEGNPTEGVWIEPGPAGDRLYQAVGAPILPPAAEAQTPYGVLVAAVPIDSAFVATLKANTNSEIVFFVRDSVGRPETVISTLPRAEVDSAIKAINPDSAFATPDSGTPDSTSISAVRVRMSAGGERWVGAVGALRTADGYPIGGYVGLRSRDVELAPYTRLRQVVIGAFLAGLLLTMLSSLQIGRAHV